MLWQASLSQPHHQETTLLALVQRNVLLQDSPKEKEISIIVMRSSNRAPIIYLTGGFARDLRLQVDL